MTARGEAERLRDQREAFELAMARNLPLPQARYELAKKRWQQADARLALRRCGTRIETGPVIPVDPSEGRELQWWQK